MGIFFSSKELQLFPQCNSFLWPKTFVFFKVPKLRMHASYKLHLKSSSKYIARVQVSWRASRPTFQTSIRHNSTPAHIDTRNIQDLFFLLVLTSKITSLSGKWLTKHKQDRILRIRKRENFQVTASAIAVFQWHLLQWGSMYLNIKNGHYTAHRAVVRSVSSY